VINLIPVIGWIISFLLSASISVPFWFCWTVCGLGQKYFYWLPETYHAIPFWNCVGLFILASILKLVFVPRFASVSNTATAKE